VKDEGDTRQKLPGLAKAASRGSLEYRGDALSATDAHSHQR